MYNPLLNDLIPVPFVEGGRDRNGLDCWGLVIEVYRIVFPNFQIPEVNIHCGISESGDIDNLSQTIRLQFNKVAQEMYSVMLIKHNDPIYINHVGIYLGAGKFIHTRKKVGVSIDRVDSMAWKRKIEGYYIPIGGDLSFGQD